MPEEVQGETLDSVPMSGGGFSWKWLALPGVITANVVLHLMAPENGVGYALSLAMGALFWGCIIGGIVWLVRGRKPGTF